MDLTRDARPLLGDRAPELGVANRTPDADEQERIGEEAQEVALGDELVRDEWREDVVEVCEQPERGSERQPAVEVVPPRAEAEAEADDRKQARERTRRE